MKWIRAANIEQELEGLPLALVLFTSKNCGGCLFLKGELAQLEGYPLFEVDLDCESRYEMSTLFHLKCLPTLFIYKNGERVSQLDGAYPVNQLKEMLHVWNISGSNLTGTSE